ncbi:MAG: hypothetical protein OXU20_22175 [Myxococcales bacterium]|nr:hypothetical protein [Myxococcales bacterium]
MRLPGAQAPDFQTALKMCGLQAERPIMDGEPHRVPVQGDAEGERSGVYLVYLTGRIAAGRIINERTGRNVRWQKDPTLLTQDEQKQRGEQLALQAHKTAAQVERQQRLAAERVVGQLQVLRPMEFASKYVAARGLQVHEGAFTDGVSGTTYLPLFDPKGKQWSMLYISDSGSQHLAPGSRTSGMFHVVGGFDSLKEADAIVIAREYADAATSAELLEQPTVMAAYADNFMPVAEGLRRQFPDKPVLMVGERDHAREAGARSAVREAAEAVRGQAVFPRFPAGTDGWDFNELARRSSVGRAAAKSQLAAAYAEVREKARQASRPQPRARASRYGAGSRKAAVALEADDGHGGAGTRSEGPVGPAQFVASLLAGASEPGQGRDEAGARGVKPGTDHHSVQRSYSR